MLVALHKDGGVPGCCCAKRRRSRHMGPHRNSTQTKGEISRQTPPRRTYVQPSPIALMKGLIMDTMPAPIKQRTKLFCQDGKLRTSKESKREQRRTQPIIEDPCDGTRSTSNAVIAFSMQMTENPTTCQMVSSLPSGTTYYRTYL